ncbi:MAG TPA: hypothetical protein PK971_12885, partial [Saprospiraceae bacterium]|nr:hypothetical protein [Saprospiraceae bacterium]
MPHLLYSPAQRLFFSCLFFVLLCGAHGVAAQARFPEKPEEFVSELGKFMTATKRPDLEEAYSVFKKTYQSGLLNASDVARVV